MSSNRRKLSGIKQYTIPFGVGARDKIIIVQLNR
jgi:hypothetical protein